MSGVRCRVSGVGVGCQVPGAEYLVPGTWYRMSNGLGKHLLPEAVSDIRHLASDIYFLIASFVVFGNRFFNLLAYGRSPEPT